MKKLTSPQNTTKWPQNSIIITIWYKMVHQNENRESLENTKQILHCIAI